MRVDVELPSGQNYAPRRHLISPFSNSVHELVANAASSRGGRHANLIKLEQRLPPSQQRIWSVMHLHHDEAERFILLGEVGSDGRVPQKPSIQLSARRFVGRLEPVGSLVVMDALNRCTENGNDGRVINGGYSYFHVLDSPVWTVR